MKKTYKYIRNYGITMFLLQALFRYMNEKKFHKIYYYLLDLKHKRVIECITRQCTKTINEITIKKDYQTTRNIWMMWWQGVETMPDVIKCCVDSVRSNAKGWNVHILTVHNYKEYVTLPDIVETRLKNGEMSFTHLCDYLRFKTLYKHGGLWLDSSVFVTKPIDIPASDKYWTYRQPEKRMPCISHCRWSGIICYMPKGHFFSEYMVRFYNQYWQTYDVIIDYFLVDYLTYIAYTTWEPFINEISNVPSDNPDMFSLLPELERGYRVKDIDMIKQLPFIKLKYKNGYAKADTNGNITLCEAFANGMVTKQLSHK